MDPGDFVKSVLTSQLLLPEESVDIMLLIKGMTPHVHIQTFSTTTRRSVPWVDDSYRTLHYTLYNKSLPRVVMHITVKRKCRKMLVASIYYVALEKSQVCPVNLNSSKATFINNITENKTTTGLVISETRFENPIILESGRTAVVEFLLSGNYYTPCHDGRSVQNEYMEFESPSGEWNYKRYWSLLVGTQYKVVK